MDGDGLEIRLDSADSGLDLHDGTVLETLSLAYDLGPLLAWHRTRNASNVSFFVTTTDGEYVLRVSHDRKTEAGLSFEVALLQYLHGAGYPTPRVVPTRWGEPYLYAENYFLVTEGIPGRLYDPANPFHLQEAGRGLARYHQVVREFPQRLRAASRPVLPTLEAHGPAALASLAGIADSHVSAADRRRLSRASSYLWSQFIRVPEALAGLLPTLSQLVIHASYGPSALVYDGDRLAGVVDHDRATYDIRALDLAYAVKAFAPATAISGDASTEEPEVALDFERCAVLMAAYAEVERLPEHELAALPLVFRAERLIKVLARTENCLRMQGTTSPEENDVVTVVDIAETEADRLRWLEEHEYSLLQALGSSLVG